MSDKRTVFFISDSTALTAETFGQSLLAQFNHIRFHQVILPFVTSSTKAQESVNIINEAAKNSGIKPIVFSTLVNGMISDIVKDSDCIFFDFIDTFLPRLEAELSIKSSHMVGSYHKINDDAYDVRMKAVNYALGNDDGISVKNLDTADVILMGVSRSGKTPTCIYMALQFGLYAANYPLTEEDFVSNDKKLYSSLIPFKKKICGLTINPNRLQKIRSERRPDSRYASQPQCKMEVAMAESLFISENIPYINVTSMSVEEIAARILDAQKLQRRVFS